MQPSWARWFRCVNNAAASHPQALAKRITPNPGDTRPLTSWIYAAGAPEREATQRNRWNLRKLTSAWHSVYIIREENNPPGLDESTNFHLYKKNVLNNRDLCFFFLFSPLTWWSECEETHNFGDNSGEPVTMRLTFKPIGTNNFSLSLVFLCSADRWSVALQQRQTDREREREREIKREKKKEGREEKSVCDSVRAWSLVEHGRGLSEPEFRLSENAGGVS